MMKQVNVCAIQVASVFNSETYAFSVLLQSVCTTPITVGVNNTSISPAGSINVVMVLRVTASCTLIVAVAIALVVCCKKTKSSMK